MEIYFRDLTQEAQACALDEAGVSDPREMNWNVFPMGDVPVGGLDDAGGNVDILKTISPKDVTGITMPSVEEYREAKDIIPRLDRRWWLRSPGYDRVIDAAFVDGEYGYVNVNGHDVRREFGVRPALRLNPESNNLQIGDKIRLAEYTWTVIPGNMALCDSFIGKHCFRKDWKAPDANDYGASDVRKFVEAWAHERGLMPSCDTPAATAAGACADGPRSDPYKVEMLQAMLRHEEDPGETHYGANLKHWAGGSNPIIIDAGGIRALIAYYSCHRTDLGNKEEKEE